MATIAGFAKEIVDLWGIGNKMRQDGVLYVLSVLQRKQHLFACRGMLRDLTESTRRRILVGQRPHLRSGDVDAAVTAAVRAIIMEVKACRQARKIMKPLFALFCSLGVLGTFFWLLHRYRRWRRSAEYDQRRARLLAAQHKLEQLGLASQVDAPCCVCIEPLLEEELEWTHKPLRSSGLRVEDFRIDESPHGGGAVARGLELFRCGHLLHSHCACSALAVRNACPLCRIADPRIRALGAGSLSTAVIASRTHGFDLQSCACRRSVTTSWK